MSSLKAVQMDQRGTTFSVRVSCRGKTLEAKDNPSWEELDRSILQSFGKQELYDSTGRVLVNADNFQELCDQVKSKGGKVIQFLAKPEGSAGWSDLHTEQWISLPPKETTAATMGDAQYSKLSEALCEAIDNSIQSLYASHLFEFYKARGIKRVPPAEIRIGVRSDGVEIRDNGVGIEDIRSLAQLSDHQRIAVECGDINTATAASPSQSQGIKYEAKVEKNVHACMALDKDYFTGDFSRYGIGSKVGAAWVGSAYYGESTYLGAPVRQSIQWETKSSGQDWETRVTTDGADELEHGTTMRISKLRRKFSKADVDNLRDDLKDVYYFYLRGFSAFCKRVRDLGAPKAHVRHATEAGWRPISIEVEGLRLADDLPDLFENAVSSYSFTVSVKSRRSTPPAHAHVVLLYYCFKNGEETIPEDERTRYYWIGRCMPGTKDRPQFLLNDKRRSKDIIPDGLGNRVQALLFFDASFRVTANKIMLDTSHERFKEFIVATRKQRKGLVDWIKDCHLKNDEEAMPVGKARTNDEYDRREYDQCMYLGTKISLGNAVKVIPLSKDEEPWLGRVRLIYEPIVSEPGLEYRSPVLHLETPAEEKLGTMEVYAVDLATNRLKLVSDKEMERYTMDVKKRLPSKLCFVGTGRFEEGSGEPPHEIELVPTGGVVPERSVIFENLAERDVSMAAFKLLGDKPLTFSVAYRDAKDRWVPRRALDGVLKSMFTGKECVQFVRPSIDMRLFAPGDYKISVTSPKIMPLDSIHEYIRLLPGPPERVQVKFGPDSGMTRMPDMRVGITRKYDCDTVDLKVVDAYEHETAPRRKAEAIVTARCDQESWEVEWDRLGPGSFRLLSMATPKERAGEYEIVFRVHFGSLLVVSEPLKVNVLASAPFSLSVVRLDAGMGGTHSIVREVEDRTIIADVGVQVHDRHHNLIDQLLDAYSLVCGGTAIGGGNRSEAPVTAAPADPSGTFSFRSSLLISSSLFNGPRCATFKNFTSFHTAEDRKYFSGVLMRRGRTATQEPSVVRVGDGVTIGTGISRAQMAVTLALFQENSSSQMQAWIAWSYRPWDAQLRGRVEGEGDEDHQVICSNFFSQTEADQMHRVSYWSEEDYFQLAAQIAPASRDNVFWVSHYYDYVCDVVYNFDGSVWSLSHHIDQSAVDEFNPKDVSEIILQVWVPEIELHKELTVAPTESFDSIMDRFAALDDVPYLPSARIWHYGGRLIQRNMTPQSMNMGMHYYLRGLHDSTNGKVGQVLEVLCTTQGHAFFGMGTHELDFHLVDKASKSALISTSAKLSVSPSTDPAAVRISYATPDREMRALGDNATVPLGLKDPSLVFQLAVLDKGGQLVDASRVNGSLVLPSFFPAPPRRREGDMDRVVAVQGMNPIVLDEINNPFHDKAEQHGARIQGSFQLTLDDSSGDPLSATLVLERQAGKPSKVEPIIPGPLHCGEEGKVHISLLDSHGTRLGPADQSFHFQFELQCTSVAGGEIPEFHFSDTIEEGANLFVVPYGLKGDPGEYELLIKPQHITEERKLNVQHARVRTTLVPGKMHTLRLTDPSSEERERGNKSSTEFAISLFDTCDPPHAVCNTKPFKCSIESPVFKTVKQDLEDGEVKFRVKIAAPKPGTYPVEVKPCASRVVKQQPECHLRFKMVVGPNRETPVDMEVLIANEVDESGDSKTLEPRMVASPPLIIPVRLLAEDGCAIAPRTPKLSLSWLRVEDVDGADVSAVTDDHIPEPELRRANVLRATPPADDGNLHYSFEIPPFSAAGRYSITINCEHFARAELLFLDVQPGSEPRLLGANVNRQEITVVKAGDLCSTVGPIALNALDKLSNPIRSPEVVSELRVRAVLVPVSDAVSPDALHLQLDGFKPLEVEGEGIPAGSLISGPLPANGPLLVKSILVKSASQPCNGGYTLQFCLVKENELDRAIGEELIELSFQFDDGTQDAAKKAKIKELQKREAEVADQLERCRREKQELVQKLSSNKDDRLHCGRAVEAAKKDITIFLQHSRKSIEQLRERRDRSLRTLPDGANYAVPIRYMNNLRQLQSHKVPVIGMVCQLYEFEDPVWAKLAAQHLGKRMWQVVVVLREHMDAAKRDLRNSSVYQSICALDLTRDRGNNLQAGQLARFPTFCGLVSSLARVRADYHEHREQLSVLMRNLFGRACAFDHLRDAREFVKQYHAPAFVYETCEIVDSSGAESLGRRAESNDSAFAVIPAAHRRAVIEYEEVDRMRESVAAKESQHELLRRQREQLVEQEKAVKEREARLRSEHSELKRHQREMEASRKRGRTEDPAESDPGQDRSRRRRRH